jgi:hypothetical protein
MFTHCAVILSTDTGSNVYHPSPCRCHCSCSDSRLQYRLDEFVFTLQYIFTHQSTFVILEDSQQEPKQKQVVLILKHKNQKRFKIALKLHFYTFFSCSQQIHVTGTTHSLCNLYKSCKKLKTSHSKTAVC